MRSCSRFATPTRGSARGSRANRSAPPRTRHTRWRPLSRPRTETTMASEEPRSQRTEKPTSRRLQKSKEKGQVPRSQELPAALGVGALLLFARIFGGRLLGSAEGFVAGSIAAIAAPLDDGAALREALRSALGTGVALGAPVIGFVAV